MDGALLSRYISFPSFLLLSLLLVLAALPPVKSGDAESLLALRPSIDPLGVLQWGIQGINVCHWQGVRECLNGRVTKLVVERFNLSGKLDGRSLNQLDQLRVLSFKQNSLIGQIPQLSGLANLKSLFLNNNMFSGRIPVTLSHLHRLKVIVLSSNRITGPIPLPFVGLNRLYVLYLQDNQLTGLIPPFNQSSLRFLNVSDNRLLGNIPTTQALTKFNESSFVGNLDLCGRQIRRPCDFFSPSASPSYMRHHRGPNKKLIWIIVPSVVGFVVLCGMTSFLAGCLRKTSRQSETRSKGVTRGLEEGGTSGVASVIRDDNNNNKSSSNGSMRGGFSWDQGAEGLGSLVFLGPGDQRMSYGLEDLLKASAETLGRGIMGSTYKAVMESGYILTVKRLKDARYPTMEEFRRHIEIVGRLRHPNLVPLRAYFQAKEERLLVYDYFPNGSLFSLIHGSRGAGGSKPLHWTSCLKIAEDLAAGLVYIHLNPGLSHGNLKSTNVLLGPDFESCLTDYGLSTFRNPEAHEESGASSLFYRAPECRDARRPMTQQADVYSYGVLLLELLTGKTPYRDLVQEHGSDIPTWVRAIREETESGDDLASTSDKLTALLNIAMACLSVGPEARPTMREVLRMIRDARAEAHLSSNNSSDHSHSLSPGRWSDTVQSLPREEHLSI
ncbi:Leucine-rich repeat protein kinase family protein [Striga hermonthica]|uniref:Leucine-rich repeat protein kinase family protein n=1 Tax=Striga hermonthica TaxID=68872 RepID=A0A9N7NBM0_STRHE|nr:Leucine-rich repeat protein kinase family protein [Striga hermonthica]